MAQQRAPDMATWGPGQSWFSSWLYLELTFHESDKRLQDYRHASTLAPDVVEGIPEMLFVPRRLLWH